MLSKFIIYDFAASDDTLLPSQIEKATAVDFLLRLAIRFTGLGAILIRFREA